MQGEKRRIDGFAVVERNGRSSGEIAYVEGVEERKDSRASAAKKATGFPRERPSKHLCATFVEATMVMAVVGCESDSSERSGIQIPGSVETGAGAAAGPTLAQKLV